MLEPLEMKKNRFTCVLGILSNGVKLPPFVVFKGKRLPKNLPNGIFVYIVNLCDIRDGISKFLGIYLIIQRYIQEIYTIEIISNVTFHVRGPFVVR